MWIFHQKGFISVVEDREDDECVVVQSRNLSHLKSFCPGFSQAKLIVDPTEMRVGTFYEHTDSDYQYMIILTKRKFKELLSCSINDIDYDDFNSVLSSSKDLRQCAVKVWQVIKSFFEER